MYDLCQYISEWLSIRAESEEITKMIWGRGNATILLSKWWGEIMMRLSKWSIEGCLEKYKGSLRDRKRKRKRKRDTDDDGER